MKKYAISREFFPLNLFAPPINKKFLTLFVPHGKPPKFLRRDKKLDENKGTMHGFDIIVQAPKH